MFCVCPACRKFAWSVACGFLLLRAQAAQPTKHAPQHSDFIESSGFKGSTGSLELIAMYVLPLVIFSVSIIQSNFVF